MIRAFNADVPFDQFLTEHIAGDLIAKPRRGKGGVNESLLATGFWFIATMAFGYYLTHVSEYSLVYGSVGVSIALMIWMYIVSLIVLFGAEFNALIFPRQLLAERRNVEQEQAAAR